jgi:hypothetical protein
MNSLMKTSRILNEKSGFMGLGVFDLAGIGYFLIITHSILEKINLEILSFFITAVLSIFLIQIRLTKRSKYIRDVLKYYFLPKNMNRQKNLKLNLLGFKNASAN